MFSHHENLNVKASRFGSGSVILRARGNDPLDMDTIREKAPSIFAADKHDSRSIHYTHIPTFEMLKGLSTEGFRPYEVRQGGSRDEAKKGFTKHMIRFRHESTIGAVAGDSIREIILLNSHDGTASYQLMSGVFRMVCTNGLIAGGEGCAIHKVRHKGDILGEVIEGAYRVIEESAMVAERIEHMRETSLHADEQEAFAHAASFLRWDEEERSVPVTASQVNRARRAQDNNPSLWHTFNRVQENLIRGELGYDHVSDNGKQSRRHTKPIQSIDGDVKLNRALWALADRMSVLKGVKAA